MPHEAVGAANGPQVNGARTGPQEAPVLAVQIRFYRPDEPITMPLPGLDETRAQSYYERLKSDVIEAQLHTDPRITIKPFARGHDELVLDPSTIQQVVLVDISERPDPTTDEIPIAVGRDDEGQAADPPTEGAALNAAQQRRIDILLG